MNPAMTQSSDESPGLEGSFDISFSFGRDTQTVVNFAERQLDIPFSFGRGSQTFVNSNFALPTSRAIEGSTDPSTFKRPRNAFLSFGDRSTLEHSIFTTNAPPTGTSETVPFTYATEVDFDPRRPPNHTFVSFGNAATTTHSTFSQIGANSQVFMFPPSIHSLPNSSTDIIKSPFRAFHAWNDPEKITALTAVHSLQTVIQIAMKNRDLNNPDKDKKPNPDNKRKPIGSNDQKLIDSLYTSFSTYMEFLNYLVESRLPERAGSLQARGISLVVLAGVAIFLGVVQLLTLAFMAWVDVITTKQNKSSTVGRVINIFAFCGVSFDTLGAMFALWTFHSLFLTISKIERIVLEKQHLNVKIHFTLDTFREVAPSSPEQPGVHTQAKVLAQEISLENLVNLFADFQQSSAKHHREARVLVHLLDDHLPVQKDFIALVMIAAGLIFFFISLFSFIISTQPLGVWASTTVVVAVTFIILYVNLGYQRPGFWRFRRARTTIAESFSLRNTRESEGEDV